MKQEDMHWYHWEAMVMEIDTLQRHNKLPKELTDEVNEIGRLTRSTGKFSQDLRERAVKVDEELKKYECQLKEILDQEEKDRI